MAVVLVADDEKMIRALAAAALKSAGHEVVTAANGVEAAALYRSSPDRIDVVVTDLKMPVMDGYQAVRLIRESRPAAKIVCMSGFFDEEPPPGVVCLHKPFLPAALRDCIEKLVSGK